MIMEEKQLFGLLRAGLDLSSPVGEELFRSPVDWPAIYRLASEQGVLAVAWDGLQRLTAAGAISADSLPDRKFNLRWAYNVERIEQHYARQEQTVGALAGFYAEHGIDMMLLKGYGLSLCYPVPRHRPCGDIDIWLYGDQRKGDDLLRKEKGVKIDEDVHHHTVFYFNGIMVENHFDFLNIHAHLSNRRIERLLRELAIRPGDRAEVDGQPFMLPNADFNALFLLRHAASHFAAAKIGLRHVLDWGLFVRLQHDRIDWERFESVARRENMDRFLHCLNALCIDRLGIDAECFPPFERDEPLETRVLNEILHPEFSKPAPRGNIVKVLCWKFLRWWANRWKHRIVFTEGLLSTFFVQLRSHLLKPKSLVH